MLGVDHDKIILLSTPFPTIPMLDKKFCYNVIVFFVGNKRCCIVLYCTTACWPHGSRCSRRAHSSLHSTSIALPTGLYTRWPMLSITPCTRAISGVGTLFAAGTLGDVWLEVAHCHTRWPRSLVKQSIADVEESTVMQNEHAMAVIQARSKQCMIGPANVHI